MDEHVRERTVLPIHIHWYIVYNECYCYYKRANGEAVENRERENARVHAIYYVVMKNVWAVGRKSPSEYRVLCARRTPHDCDGPSEWIYSYRYCHHLHRWHDHHRSSQFATLAISAHHNKYTHTHSLARKKMVAIRMIFIHYIHTK